MQSCLTTISPLRQGLGLLVALAILWAAPGVLAQSGRNKQPATTKTNTPSSGGTTRPKRTGPSTEPQTQTSPQTTPPVRLPSGAVILNEPPPPAPTPKPTPTPAPAAASAGDEIGSEDVVRISSNLVTVPASVVDTQGRAVIDLRLEDFELRVDGQPKSISELSRSEVPVTLALLFDNSQSLTAARELEKQAAIKFFRSVVRPIDRAAIYSVATDVSLVQPLTSNVPWLVRTIEHFGKPEGATRLLDAIVEAASYLRPYPGRKVIVIVSDGEDTLSDNTDFDAVLRKVLGADCQVYAVQTKQIEYAMLTGEVGNANIRSLAAERRLQDLTAHTGGAVYTPLQTSDLDAAFTQISADLAQQYLLSYYPTDERQDGRFRTISVRVSTRPNMRVRARRGYYPRRPSEKFSYTPMPGPANAPAIAQSSNAARTDSLPGEMVQTSSLPPLASSVAPAQPETVAVRSRRRGPSETSDEPEAVSSVKTTANLGDPIAKREEPRQTTAAKAKESPPQPSTQPQPASTQNSTPKSSAASPNASSPNATTRTASATLTVSGGVLNGKAISLPKPQYPPNARNLRAEGVVTVEVLLDEIGKVVSAKAVDGPPLLRQAAVVAARQARFSPTMLSGEPVKVAGLITYKFSLGQ